MNLKQLLALPLAFALGWSPAYTSSRRLIHYRWAVALSDLTLINQEMQYRFRAQGGVNDEMLQRWIEGTTLETDSPKIPRDAEPRIDPWGNPYQVCKLIDENGKRKFGVFSFGRDGVSVTKGSDLDDINSWTEEPVSYYQREAARDSRIHQAWWTIPWACVIYTPLFILLRSRKKTAQSVGDEVLD